LENRDPVFVRCGDHVFAVSSSGPHIETLVRDRFSVTAVQNSDVDLLRLEEWRKTGNGKQNANVQLERFQYQNGSSRILNFVTRS